MSRPEASSGSGDALESCRALLAAVDGLPPIEREVIALRYFDGLPPRQIAARLAIPIETVRSRIKRAHARLRARLTRDGHGSGWAVVLMPLLDGRGYGATASAAVASKDAASAVLASVGILMMTKAQIAAAVFGLVVLGAVGWELSGGAASKASVGADTDATGPTAMADAGVPGDGADRTFSDAASADDPAALSRALLDSSIGPAFEVRGTARLGSNEVLPHARLVAELFEGVDVQGQRLRREELVANRDGRFSWSGPASEGPITVRVRSMLPEPAKQGEAVATIVPGRPSPDDLELNCWPLDSRLRLHVVDRDGTAVAGARVAPEPRADRLHTDEDGRVELPVSSARARARVFVAGPGLQLTRVEVDIPGPDSVVERTVVLEPAAVIRGRVVDTTGRAVARAKVETFFTSQFGPVETDVDGRFRLDYLEVGRTRHSVYVRKDGFSTASQDVDMAATPRPDIQLVLRRGGRVVGTVVDSDGHPVAAASMYIGFDPTDYTRIHARSDANGRFEFVGVPLGDRSLCVEARGLAPTLTTIRVDEDRPSDVIVRMLSPGRIGGVVVDEQGEPVPGVRLSARFPTSSEPEGSHRRGRYAGGSGAETTDEGRFLLDGVPNPQVVLECWGSGVVRSVSATLPVGRSDHVIRVVRAATVAGTVIDAESRQPIRSFHVRILRSTAGGYSVRWIREGVAITSDVGHLVLDEELRPGAEYVLAVGAPGYAPQVKRLTATVAPDPADVVFELEAGVTVQGRVVDAATHEPVPDARVFVTDSDQPLSDDVEDELYRRAKAVTDADGAFRIDDVGAGEISLVVRHAEWPEFVDGPFRIDRGHPCERLISLPRFVTLSGIVVDTEGRVIPGAAVRIEHRAPDSRRRDPLIADDEGRFSCELPPGEFTASFWDVTDRDGRQLVAHREVSLAPGEKPAELRLAPEASTHVLVRWSGIGDVPTSLGLLFWPLRADGERDHRISAVEHAALRLDERSEMTIVGLPPGRYRIQTVPRDGPSPDWPRCRVVTEGIVDRETATVVELRPD